MNGCLLERLRRFCVPWILAVIGFVSVPSTCSLRCFACLPCLARAAACTMLQIRFQFSFRLQLSFRVSGMVTPCTDNGAHLYVVLLTLSRSLPWQFSVIDLESSAPLGMLGIHFVIFWISALSLVLLSFDVLPTGILSTLDLSFRGRLSACLAAPTFPVIRDDMFFYGSLRFVPA